MFQTGLECIFMFACLWAALYYCFFFLENSLKFPRHSQTQLICDQPTTSILSFAEILIVKHARLCTNPPLLRNCLATVRSLTGWGSSVGWLYWSIQIHDTNVKPAWGGNMRSPVPTPGIAPMTAAGVTTELTEAIPRNVKKIQSECYSEELSTKSTALKEMNCLERS